MRGLTFVAGALVGCGAMVMAQSPPADPLKSVAERYVKLVLAVGQHDADYVDAFYGPPEWKKEIETAKPSLATIDQQATALEREVAKAPSSPPIARDAELWKLRIEYLARQLSSLRARVAMLQGKRLTFDEESRALYDAVAPTKAAADSKLFSSRLTRGCRAPVRSSSATRPSNRRLSSPRRASIACSRRRFARAASAH